MNTYNELSCYYYIDRKCRKRNDNQLPLTSFGIARTIQIPKYHPINEIPLPIDIKYNNETVTTNNQYLERQIHNLVSGCFNCGSKNHVVKDCLISIDKNLIAENSRIFRNHKKIKPSESNIIFLFSYQIARYFDNNKSNQDQTLEMGIEEEEIKKSMVLKPNDIHKQLFSCNKEIFSHNQNFNNHQNSQYISQPKYSTRHSNYPQSRRHQYQEPHYGSQFYYQNSHYIYQQSSTRHSNYPRPQSRRVHNQEPHYGYQSHHQSKKRRYS